jgi:hypothetical protein
VRDELLKPTKPSPNHAPAKELAAKLYSLHEAGKDYAKELTEFGKLVGKQVSKFDVDSAFGTCDADEWVASYFPSPVPKDLTREEMIELFSKLNEAGGTPTQQTFWIQCLEINTGDENVSDLIFWPGIYFGDGNNRRKMTAVEMLDTALTAGKKAEAPDL